jgi:hypothetical protein
MPTDQKKHQRKLEKRAAKRKEKRHVLVRQQSAGLFQRQSEFVRHPILHCTISDSCATNGMGWVILSRQSHLRQVAYNAFLVDCYCLGVKNIISDIISRSDYDIHVASKLRGGDQPSRSVAPAEALKFLEEAVAYARGLGLPPHADFQKAIKLFGDANPNQSDAQFTFGKNGKPFFISGPNDTPERCEQILSILNNTVGLGNHQFTMQIGRLPLDGEIEEMADMEELEDASCAEPLQLRQASE